MTPEDYLRRARHILGMHRLEFERGYKGALLKAIYYCALSRFPLPKWAKEAFEAAESRAKSGEIESWDEVFGKPWGVGRRKARLMESRGKQISFAVTALRQRGMSIESAFAKVAATKHMTVPTVRRYYYDVDRRYKKLDHLGIYKQMRLLAHLSQVHGDFEKR